MRHIWMAALLLVSGQLAGAWVETPLRANEAATPVAILIPFSPELGKPLRLRGESVKSEVKAGVETIRQRVDSEEELVFTEKNDEGYILSWTTKAAKFEASPQQKALLESLMAATIDQPILIQTDFDGSPVAVVNLDDMRAVINGALDGLLASLDQTVAPGEKVAMRQAFAAVAGMYRSMKDDQLNGMLLEDAGLMLGFGGFELVPGEAVPFKTTHALPMVETAIDVEGQVDLRSATAQELVVVITSKVDRTHLRAVTASYLERLLTQVAPEQRDAAIAQVKQLEGIEMTTEQVATLDAATGLMRMMVYKKRTGVEGQIRIDTKRYSRMD
jgi:hypothetical protein